MPGAQPAWVRAVEHRFPRAIGNPWQREWHGALATVDQHHQGRRSAAGPADEASERALGRLAPCITDELAAICAQPHQIAQAAHVSQSVVPALAQRQRLPTQRQHSRRESQQLNISMCPVKPHAWVVLAIGVVVARLGTAQLVAGSEHWRALSEQRAR